MERGARLTARVFFSEAGSQERNLRLSFSWLPGFGIHSSSAQPIIIGSKKFTESYVLAEIAKHSLGNAEHRQGMGGTIILWEALRSGQIQVYPEYTVTIAEEI